MGDGSGSWPGAIPDDLLGLIKPELAPDERLIWASSGGHGEQVEASWLRTWLVWASGLTLASFFSCGGALNLFGPAIARADVGLMTIAVLAGTIGFFIFLALFGGWRSARAQRRLRAMTVYALTDRRAIIWRPRENSSAVEVFSYPASHIKNIHRVEFPDGSGEVAFVVLHPHHGYPGGVQGIADVRKVEDLIRRTLMNPDPDRVERGTA